MSETQGVERLVGGRYRLVEMIGRGGMGTVWRAHDTTLGRDIAIKELTPPSDMTAAEREIFTTRTFREARAAGRISHPGVAAVYDVLQERGHPWIAMQLVPSRTLGEVLRDDGPMTPLQTAEIGLRMLAALRAAHAAGVLHRDVKPDNVLLAHDGQIVLTDFGIATLEDDSPVTRTGVLIGTPAFIAPERAAGNNAERSSDLWSLGVTLYMAVEGHSPFHRGNALATLAAVLHDSPAPLCRAGPLAPVITGLLEKDPARRLTADEAVRRLQPIASGLSPQATAPIPAVAVTALAEGAASERAAEAVAGHEHLSGAGHATPPYGGHAVADGTARPYGAYVPDQPDPHPGFPAEPVTPYRAAQAHEDGPPGGGRTPHIAAGAVPAPREAGSGTAAAHLAGAVPVPPAVPRASRPKAVTLAGLTGLTLLVGMVSGGVAWWSARPQPPGPVVPTVITTVTTQVTPPPAEERNAELPPVVPEQAPESRAPQTPEAPDDRERPDDDSRDRSPAPEKTKEKSPAPEKTEKTEKPPAPEETDPPDDDGSGNDRPTDEDRRTDGRGPAGPQGEGPGPEGSGGGNANGHDKAEDKGPKESRKVLAQDSLATWSSALARSSG